MFADDGFRGSSCRLGGCVAICIFPSFFPLFLFPIPRALRFPGGACPSLARARKQRPVGPSSGTLLGRGRGLKGRDLGARVDGWGGASGGGGGVLDQVQWGGSPMLQCADQSDHTVADGKTGRADRKRDRETRGPRKWTCDWNGQQRAKKFALGIVEESRGNFRVSSLCASFPRKPSPTRSPVRIR